MANNYNYRKILRLTTDTMITLKINNVKKGVMKA
jgi:hypothetical protein